MTEVGRHGQSCIVTECRQATGTPTRYRSCARCVRPSRTRLWRLPKRPWATTREVDAGPVHPGWRRARQFRLPQGGSAKPVSTDVPGVLTAWQEADEPAARRVRRRGPRGRSLVARDASSPSLVRLVREAHERPRAGRSRQPTRSRSTSYCHVSTHTPGIGQLG